MSIVWSLLRRDLKRFGAQGTTWLPVAFFLLVATLYPFAVGPDAAQLRKTGAGMLWVSALLAALLPVERLFLADREAGVLDQLAVRGIADELVALARLIAHWLSFTLPLIVAVFPAAALLDLDAGQVRQLLLGLLVGSPGLAALGIMVAAITAGLRGAGAVGGLLLLPLAIPVLIFGAGMPGDPSGSAIKWLAATALCLVAIAPFAAGAALRAGRD